MTKCNGASKILCLFKAFAMVSAKKLQNFGCRAIFTFKTMKNGQNWSKIEIYGHDKMQQSSKNLVPFESFCHGE